MRKTFSQWKSVGALEARAPDLKKYSQGSWSALLVSNIFQVKSNTVTSVLVMFAREMKDDVDERTGDVHFLHFPRKIKDLVAPSDAQTAQFKIKICIKSSSILDKYILPFG